MSPLQANQEPSNNQSDNPQKDLMEKQEVSVPAYLKKEEGDLGTETIGRGDIVIPRIKICQALSKLKNDLDDLKDGQLYNTCTNIIYGGAIQFFILLHWPSKVWFSGEQTMRCTQFRNITTGKMEAFGNEVEECLHGTPSTDPKLLPKDSQNYMIILESELKQAVEKKTMLLPIIYSAMSAAIKFARQLNMKLKTSSQSFVPIWGQLITMTTNLDPFKAAPAWMPRFSYGRWATEAEYKYMEEMYKVCRELQGREETYRDEAPEESEDDPQGENVPRETELPDGGKEAPVDDEELDIPFES